MSVVESHRDGVVGWIVFNRPDVLNAMNAEIFAGFDHCLAAFSAERDIRVIAVTGAGRAFSTGADLHALAGRTPADQRRVMQTGHAMMASVEAAPKPIIAAVNGIAAGGGFEFALACDFIFAERRAQFGLTEIRYGFLPGGGGTQRLPRRISWSHAMYLICSGDLISADRAATLGLAFQLADDGKLHSAVQEFADNLARSSAEAIASAKALMRCAMQEPLDAGLQAEIASNLELMQSETAIAAMTAFLKRNKRNQETKERRSP